LVHVWFTPSEGPKGFVNWFLKKSDYGSWTMEKCHLPCSDSMVHSVKTTLNWFDNGCSFMAPWLV
jgi:hypothetical protein